MEGRDTAVSASLPPLKLITYFSWVTAVSLQVFLTKPNLPAQTITLNQIQKSSAQFQGELH